MEQIFSYAWLFFVGIVLSGVELLDGWLMELGLSSWLVLTWIFGLIYLNVLDKWTVDVEGRVLAIEAKLGMKYTPPAKTRSYGRLWFKTAGWFILAVFILGKSLQGSGFLAFSGIGLAAIMLLLCAFCACWLIYQASCDYWSKKRERQELLDKISAKEESD